MQLIDDKKALSEKCEQLVTELKTVDKKYQDKMKNLVLKFVSYHYFFTLFCKWIFKSIETATYLLAGCEKNVT